MAGAHNEQLRRLLAGNAGLEYLRRTLHAHIADRPIVDVMPATSVWLQQAHALLTSSNAAAIRCPAAAQVRQHVTEGFVAIASSGVALTTDTCPETLHLDLQRIYAMQNEVQRLSLIAAVQVISQQILREQGVSTAMSEEHRAWLASLRHRLSVCMAQDDTNLDSLAVEVVHLTEQRCTLAGVTMPEETKNLAAAMVRRTVSVTDAMYKFALGTVRIALRAALGGAEEGAVKALLEPVQGGQLADVVVRLAAAIRPVLDLNVQVYEPVYTTIIHGFLVQDRSPDSSGV